ncbi:hypothetical protein LZG94_25540 [Dyadobacter sp. CY343]|nr:hypothetical protein [Dyadobacter sp. CY343]
MFILVTAAFTFLGQLFPLEFFQINFAGKVAPQNPWHSNTLEWTTPVNPGHGYWPGKLPVVYPARTATELH